jgi:hypothetical protein
MLRAETFYHLVHQSSLSSDIFSTVLIIRSHNNLLLSAQGQEHGQGASFLEMSSMIHVDGGHSFEQPRYLHDMLNRFQMADCRAASTPVPGGLNLSRYDGALLPPNHQYHSSHCL